MNSTPCSFRILEENAGLAAADATSDKDAWIEYRGAYIARHGAELVACGACEACCPSPAPWHQHVAAKRNYTHDSLNHGFDRCVETCACGHRRVLTRECGEPGPTYTEWAATE
jgi:hypothetical protein